MLAARIGGYVVAAHLRRQLSKDHEVLGVSSNRLCRPCGLAAKLLFPGIEHRQKFCETIFVL